MVQSINIESFHPDIITFKSHEVFEIVHINPKNGHFSREAARSLMPKLMIIKLLFLLA
jgi:hypothetical protein